MLAHSAGEVPTLGPPTHEAPLQLELPLPTPSPPGGAGEPESVADQLRFGTLHAKDSGSETSPSYSATSPSTPHCNYSPGPRAPRCRTPEGNTAPRHVGAADALEEGPGKRLGAVEPLVGSTALDLLVPGSSPRQRTMDRSLAAGATGPVHGDPLPLPLGVAPALPAGPVLVQMVPKAVDEPLGVALPARTQPELLLGVRNPAVGLLGARTLAAEPPASRILAAVLPGVHTLGAALREVRSPLVEPLAAAGRLTMTLVLLELRLGEYRRPDSESTALRGSAAPLSTQALPYARNGTRLL